MHLEISGGSACVRTGESVLEDTEKLKDSNCLPWALNGPVGDCLSQNVCHDGKMQQPPLLNPEQSDK